MFRQPVRVLSLAAALCAVMGTTACKTTADIWRYEAAARIAAPANLQKRQVLTDPYAITVYERIGKKGNAATIYFEGAAPFAVWLGGQGGTAVPISTAAYRYASPAVAVFDAIAAACDQSAF